MNSDSRQPLSYFHLSRFIGQKTSALQKIPKGAPAREHFCVFTLQSYPFLAQYNESDYLAFSTYSLYTKWRRYCYVIEGSPFFQEQTNIHTYTSTSTPAALSDELDDLELQNIIILEELSAKQDFPNFNYWSFWADLNINFGRIFTHRSLSAQKRLCEF